MSKKKPTIITLKKLNSKNKARYECIMDVATRAIIDDHGESFIDTELAPMYDDGSGCLNYSSLCSDLCACVGVLTSKISILETELSKKRKDKINLVKRMKAQEDNMRVLRNEVLEWMKQK